MLASCPSGWVQDVNGVTCPSGMVLLSNDASSVISSLSPEMLSTYFLAGFSLYLTFWLVSWPLKAVINFLIGLKK